MNFRLLEHETVYTMDETADQSSLRGVSHWPHPLSRSIAAGRRLYHGPGQIDGLSSSICRRTGRIYNRVFDGGSRPLLIESLASHDVHATARNG